MRFVAYIKDNPVVLLDLVKYVLAALVLFGLPIPPGIDVVVAGAVLAVLTLVTRAKVVPVAKHDLAVEDALNTTAPTPEVTGEADYLAQLEGTDTAR
ncbi:hypothetical protein [Micromonospora coerulea]|uniref:hypothetical protein n=1 Tax=Micromonospora coerulea TaxID=47856 RepID=UPI0019078EB6|nr:hypothetical protein [Micromonospora veneta]